MWTTLSIQSLCVQINVMWHEHPLAHNINNDLDQRSAGAAPFMPDESIGPGTLDLDATLAGQGSPNIDSVISLLRIVLVDQQKYKQLVRCDATDAQILLDCFQRLLDLPDLDWDLRRKLIIATQRISVRSKLYPTCYELKDVEQVGSFPVARGGFAEIFKGKFEGQLICIKAISVYQNSDLEHVFKQFGKEALLWGQLVHPNILPIFGFFRLADSGRPCLVSPWMENGTVTTYLNNNPNAPRVLLARDVARGLHYLHSIGVIHGDIKAANVLVDEAGRGRLADFGISSIWDPHIMAWTTQTAAASRGGSVRWQAPELFDPEGDEIIPNTFQSDIYALG
ncbi:hypothetical protein H0H93_012588, partial [Arthromyces matolae]